MVHGVKILMIEQVVEEIPGSLHGGERSVWCME